MICNLNNINQMNHIIQKEGLQVLVVSYGGSCTNQLVDILEKNHYTCKTNIWAKILCHCPKYININIPIIYIYDNPIKSFLSMKRRGVGYWDLNQKKLSNNNNIILSDENLIKLMIRQFYLWTYVKRDNVLILKANELFENTIVDKLEGFLKRKLHYLPIIYKTPTVKKADIENPENDLLFQKYYSEINYINKFNPNDLS